jgi:hypothetical protein
MGGKTEQKSTSNSTQTTAIDPAYRQLQLGNYGRAQGVADQLGQAYSGPLSADYSGTTLPQATSGFQGLASYAAPTLANANYQQYENPFQNDVINSTIAQAMRAKGISDANAQAQATAAGAFGGSRSAVLQNLNDDSWQRNLQSTLAGLNSQNFQQAQQAAGQDIGNNLASAGIRGNANSALANIAGLQYGASQSALDRAYNAWLAQQQGALSGQSLLNGTVYGLSAPTTTTGQSSSDTTQTQTPGLGQILGGLGSLAMGIGTGGLGFAPFAAGGAAGAAGGYSGLASLGNLAGSTNFQPFSFGG